MRSLSRKDGHRKSTLRNLATSLILFERISTTTAKAKELKPIVEHLINSARPGDLNGRRKLLAYLFDENATKKTIDVLIPRYKDTPSGFIKSYKTVARKGDNAELMILELQKPKETIKEDNAKTSKPVAPKAIAKPTKVKSNE